MILLEKLKKGILQRKTVCGNTIHPKITQINLKVLKQGTSDIFADAGKKKEEKKEEGKEEKPAEKAPVKKDAPPEKKEEPKTKETPKAEPKKAEEKK